MAGWLISRSTNHASLHTASPCQSFLRFMVSLHQGERCCPLTLNWPAGTSRLFPWTWLDTESHPRTFSFATFLEIVTDAYEAVHYVQANDADSSKSTWGVIGHSLGAGVAMLMQDMPVQPNATVIIGGGMGENFGGLSMPLNQTSPRNLMIVCGLYDELVSPELAYSTLRTATGLSSVSEGTTYGDFSNGSARSSCSAPQTIFSRFLMPP